MIRLIKDTLRKGTQAMHVILHMGAHRCATTTFHAYLDQNWVRLLRDGIDVWTPQTTRAGLFDGMICPPRHDSKTAIKRIQRKIDAMSIDQLLVSEENMIGTPRDNLKCAALAVQPRRWSQIAQDMRATFPDIPLHRKRSHQSAAPQ